MPRRIIQVQEISDDPPELSLVASRSYDLDLETVRMVRSGDWVQGVSHPKRVFADELAAAIRLYGNLSTVQSAVIAREANRALKHKRDYLNGRIHVRRISS